MSHLSQTLLGRVLGGTASEAEVDRTEAHLRGCRSCLRLAAKVVAGLSAQGKLAAAGNGGSATVLKLVREEDEETVRDAESAGPVGRLEGEDAGPADRGPPHEEVPSDLGTVLDPPGGGGPAGGGRSPLGGADRYPGADARGSSRR